MRVRRTLPSGAVQFLDIEDVLEAVPRREVHLITKDVVVDAPALATGGRRIVGWDG